MGFGVITSKRPVTDHHRPLEIPCEDHPRYQGKRPPRQPCWACWHLYLVKNRPATAAAAIARLHRRLLPRAAAKEPQDG